MTKIDLFRDKEYEEFDWLNKAVEPIIFSLSEKFAQIPSETGFSVTEAMDIVEHGAYISKKQLISHVAKMSEIDISSTEVDNIKDLFEVKIPSDMVFSFSDLPADKVITVVKKVQTMSDHQIRDIVAACCANNLRRINKDRADMGRMNEVLDILNAQAPSRKGRSFSAKLSDVIDTTKNIVIEDRWRIRNMELLTRMSQWIIDYVHSGNLASMSNLIRLKCMTHNGDPIYSMQETI